ncbi:glycoprotein endo-alpha-1,2-mannosidase-like protein [Sorex araneus]|uniref:glycoprotein endo-alpha-1,2-mannosidase-like protein n=1 Tax=Sorex araneus TaxID=42254 RepID=UPI0024333A2D|nr:glycoprotein endo-alpha-1,2-mannosidase-like protein [Sorex araneus]
MADFPGQRSQRTPSICSFLLLPRAATSTTRLLGQPRVFAQTDSSLMLRGFRGQESGSAAAAVSGPAEGAAPPPPPPPPVHA